MLTSNVTFTRVGLFCFVVGTIATVALLLSGSGKTTLADSYPPCHWYGGGYFSFHDEPPPIPCWDIWYINIEHGETWPNRDDPRTGVRAHSQTCYDGIVTRGCRVPWETTLRGSAQADRSPGGSSSSGSQGTSSDQNVQVGIKDPRHPCYNPHNPGTYRSECAAEYLGRK